MTDKCFKILRLHDGSALVVILSLESTSSYWEELQHDLSETESTNDRVYFDFLYRNGLRNRFFVSHLIERRIPANSLRSCDATKVCLDAADSFFASNIYWIESSVLSNFQKNFFKKKILNRKKNEAGAGVASTYFPVIETSSRTLVCCETAERYSETRSMGNDKVARKQND